MTTSLCIGAGLVLLLALLMGPVFCGWFCPYGFFSELARGMALRCGRVAQGPRPPLFAAKALIVCAGLLGVLFYAPMPLLNQLSMPGWYSRAMQHAAFYGEALPGALILFPSLLVTEILSGWRFWCLGLCPQSVLIALAGAVLPGRLHVRFNGTSCTCTGPERPCRKQCSLDLDPRAEHRRRRLQCGNCGDCIDVCRKKGVALRFAFGKKI